MEEILIPLGFFGFLTIAIGLRTTSGIVRRYFDFKERQQIAAGGPASEALRGEVEQLRASNSSLVERVENLETIVTSVDLELNQRLNRVLSEASRVGALPPALAGKDERPTGLLAVGQLLGKRYEIREELGRGGMGAVYRAWDPRLNEEVAIKVILPMLGDGGGWRERFLREASAARRISHRNVVRVYDVDIDGHLLYLSMEFFRGRTLKEILARQGPPAPRETGDLAGQILDGLTAAHEAGVVHRDLKPQNVLVGDDGLAKIIDFGLARPLTATGLTATGVVLGTPEYMAPEQLRGRDAGVEVDIYAAGSLIYELLTGRPPFTGDSAISVALAHLREAPLPPSRLRSLPDGLDAVILKALAKAPADRYPSAAAMKRELVTALARG